MKRIAIVLGIAAAIGVSPSVAAGSNVSAHARAQSKMHVLAQVVSPQRVSAVVAPQTFDFQRWMVRRWSARGIVVLQALYR